MSSGANLIRPTDHSDFKVILDEPRLVQRGSQGLDIDSQAGLEAVEPVKVGQLTSPQDIHYNNS